MKNIVIATYGEQPKATDILARALLGTGLSTRPPVKVEMGEYTWDYNDVSDLLWEHVVRMLRTRMNRMHEQGLLAYAKW